MRILFVGDYDICRGPMATAFLRSQLANGAIDVRSTGIQSIPGKPLHPLTAKALSARGISFHHRANKADRATLNWASVILTMTRPQKIFLIRLAPMIADKIYTFQAYIGNPIYDILPPLAEELEAFQDCAETIASACHLLYQEILEESNNN